MNDTKAMLLGALLALPSLSAAQAREAAHAHEAPRPAQVQAALDAVKASLPPPRWKAIRETRVATTGAKSVRDGTRLELGTALGQTVVVVLDEHGVPHTECVESAPPSQADR